jgi:hypothetical protein
MSSLVQELEEAVLRKNPNPSLFTDISENLELCSVSLAQKGHSVFLIEAGGDHGENPLQMAPLLGAAAAENETMSWEFFVNHYRDFEQGRRDSKYTYRLPNGELYIGLDPPADSTPYVTLVRSICASGHRDKLLI